MIDYSIVGKRFGHLKVIELDHVDLKTRGTWWKCRCDCGNTTIVRRGSLSSGDTISCGCYHKEHTHDFAKTHGLTYNPLYTVWRGMIQRCTNQNASNYERYGGRGIDVCDEWRHNPENFCEWALSNGYKSGLTLDRKNNNLGYYPENCRWTTRKVQQNNTRRNRMFTYNGQTHSVAEWSRILNVNAETLRYRIIHGNFTDFENLN